MNYYYYPREVQMIFLFHVKHSVGRQFLSRQSYSWDSFPSSQGYSELGGNGCHGLLGRDSLLLCGDSCKNGISQNSVSNSATQSNSGYFSAEPWSKVVPYKGNKVPFGTYTWIRGNPFVYFVC
jgi:hypothetical protein